MTRPEKGCRLLLASDCITQEAPLGDDLCFQHSVLCQISLPRSRLPGIREFRREQGAAWLIVQAGTVDLGAGPVEQELPYGVLPRLILTWLNTYAIRHQTPTVPIGGSAAEFLRMMGKNSSGGQRGGYRALGQQLPALAACRIQMGSVGRNFGGQPIERFQAWMPASNACWPGELTLSQSYFADLQRSAVPLDRRAVDALSHSSLALDLYLWLAHRLHRVGPRGQLISWYQICAQFGAEYKGLRPLNDLQKKFRQALRDVLLVYPKAKVEVGSQGLFLKRSSPPVNKLSI